MQFRVKNMYKPQAQPTRWRVADWGLVHGSKQPTRTTLSFKSRLLFASVRISIPRARKTIRHVGVSQNCAPCGSWCSCITLLRPFSQSGGAGGACTAALSSATLLQMPLRCQEPMLNMKKESDCFRPASHRHVHLLASLTANYDSAHLCLFLNPASNDHVDLLVSLNGHLFKPPIKESCSKSPLKTIRGIYQIFISANGSENRKK